ncbi:MAG: aminoglycoside phosphotransferase [Gammaproteobacteria bacterium]|nr:aminoglycoside phosphotransferase [Gammaproteobacteria bacterium]
MIVGSPGQDGRKLEAVARIALRAWDISADCRLTLLKYRENAVFAVVIRDKPTYVLRVHRRGYHSDAALYSELTWMISLADQGIPTPRVVPTSNGDILTLVRQPDEVNAYQCDLLSWISGAPLGQIEERSFGDREFIERAYKQVGRLAARVHAHSAQWHPGESFTRHSWDEAGCLAKPGVWGYFGDLQTLSTAERALLHGAAEVARQRLGAFGRLANRYGLIHGDLVPENVLLDGNQCTLIDFDDCGFGWYVAEIATAVFFQLGTPSFAPALRAMIHGYRQVRALDDGDLDMLDVMLFLRGMALLGWIQTRAETETARKIRRMVTESSTALAARLTGNMKDKADLNAALELPSHY